MVDAAAWIPCEREGQRSDWIGKLGLTRRPACNRPDGHDGPCREYGRGAEVRAEWNG